MDLLQRFPKARILGAAIGNSALLANLNVVDRVDLPTRYAGRGAAAGPAVLAGVMARVEEQLTGEPHHLLILQGIQGGPFKCSGPRFRSTSPIANASLLPTPPVTASSIMEMNGWKTYRNNQFHFEITLPDAFRLEETTYPLTDADVNSQDIADFYGLDVLDQTDTIHYFGLAVGKSRLTLEAYEQTKKNPIRYDSAWTITRRFIDGISGFDTYGYAAEAHLYSQYFDFVHDGYIYTIFLDPVIENRITADTYPGGGSGGCCNDYDPAKKKDIYRTILASFKVTDSP